MHQEVFPKFEEVRKKTQATRIHLGTLQQKQESFIIQYQDSLRITSQIHQLTNQPNGQINIAKEVLKRKQQMQMHLDEKTRELLNLRLKLAQKLEETVSDLRPLQTHILDEQLVWWRRQQQLSGNGAPLDDCLDTLQQWCERLADMIWQNRQQIQKLDMLSSQLPIEIPHEQQQLFPKLDAAITGLLSALVTSTFVVEMQPPQLMKRDSRFTTTVSLLVGSRLNVHMNPPAVRAAIISEKQVRQLLLNNKDVKEGCGRLLNNVGIMDYNQAKGRLSVTFKNMQLRTIRRRADRRGSEIVTEEKFSILFQSEFAVGGGQLVFKVWTISLPVVVTVNGNQDCKAMATIFWDNAFSEPGRTPFEVPTEVPWSLLAESLSCKFNASTGVVLSSENLNYLASKLFGPAEDYSHGAVTWAQLNRDPLPGCNFSFWDWFYAALKLTKDCLLELWQEGAIYGFISRQEASKRLMQRQTGTFLCRFSDSELGGITVAWIGEDPKNPGQKMVWNLAPLKHKDFNIRGLPDRIKDLSNLVWLLPDIPKEQVFGKYWSQPTGEVPPRGYIGTEIVAVISRIHAQPAVPLRYGNPTPNVHSQEVSGHSVYETTGQPPQGCSESAGDGSQLEPDSVEDLFFGLNTMDYLPEDIDQINVNQLVNLCDESIWPN